MTLLRNLIVASLVFSFGTSSAQMKDYNFYRELEKPTDQWHKIVLPTSLDQHLSQEMFDLRVYGITASGDTIEAPYLMEVANKVETRNQVSYSVLNSSFNKEAYFFTLDLGSKQLINELELFFGTTNFDWDITIEGSDDQNEWLTVVDNYRILSISSDAVSFRYSKVSIPTSNYRFYRVTIPTSEDPVFRTAQVSEYSREVAQFNPLPTTILSQSENPNSKRTSVHAKTASPQLINRIQLHVQDTVDYYRQLTIKTITDSVKTEKGWVYNYRTIGGGVLNSFDDRIFDIGYAKAHQLIFEIANQDNAPLTISKVEAFSLKRELHVRFDQPATYYLTYGKTNPRSPRYDLQNFRKRIPTSMSSLSLGEEMTIAHDPIEVTSPLFENKIWLWVVMGIVVLILGWFSIGMLKGGER